MNLNSPVERMKFLYQEYEQDNMDHFLKTFSAEVVNTICNDIQIIKLKDETKDSYEDAKTIIRCVTAEVADRIKAELEFRLARANDLVDKQKEVEKQLE